MQKFQIALHTEGNCQVTQTSLGKSKPASLARGALAGK